MRKILIISTIILQFLIPLNASRNYHSKAWGFYAHEQINRIAVFTLPPPMFIFYKKHIRYLTENATKPDKRRYAVKEEAPRHYIDLDVYGDSALNYLPKYWNKAVEKIGEDTLLAYGIVPWHVNFVAYQLTKAFEEKDENKILRLSADLGHYIADANVPLHTTENYNGQLTGQYGIHGFWESRLPELYAKDYDFFVGQASYIENTQLAIWNAVAGANNALDSVLNFDLKISSQLRDDEKYSHEMRGNVNTLVYSREYSDRYHTALSGQVERQMRKAIKMVGDFWYSCWVNAGQPDLQNFEEQTIIPYDSLESPATNKKDTTFTFREHESSVLKD